MYYCSIYKAYAIMKKLITISDEVRVGLDKKAGELGLRLGPYIRMVLTRDVGVLPVVVGNISDKGVVEDMYYEDLDSTEPKRVLKEKKSEEGDLDKGGVFKRIERGIYGNGECFEVRKYGDDGVYKEYFGSIEDARDSRAVI